MSTGPNPIPAGLEMAFELEKDKVANPLDAFVLSLHWSITRTGLRQRASDSEELTERLPANWPQRLEGDAAGAPRTLTLTYYDPQAPQIKYELRVIELTPNEMVAVTFFRSPTTNSGSSTPLTAGQPNSETSAAASANRPASSMKSGVDKNSAASTFQIGNFVKSSAFEEGGKRERASDVYEHADVLETQLYESIMEPLGLRVLGQAPVPGPYDDKTKTEQPASQQPSRQPVNILQDDRFYHPDLGRHPSPFNPGMPMGPLGIPPIGGPGGLGHSDLDPLGRFGVGNILDPRGFRNPAGGRPGIFPGGIGAPPPGARFDPFGPPNPARPDGGTGSFAFPNPDHERPPSSDYDDMFM